MVAIESPIVNEEVVETAVEAKASAKKPSTKKASAKKAVKAPKASAKKPTKKAPVVSAPSPAPSKKDVKKATVAPTASAPSPTKKASAKPSKEAKEKAVEAPKASEKKATVEKLPIRKPQLRVLQALAINVERPLSRNEIAEAAQIDIAPLVEYLGSSDEARRKANDAKHFPSLISLGYVKLHLMEGQPATYSITSAGKKFEQTWSAK